MTQFYFKINLNKFGELRLQQEQEQRSYRSFVSLFVLGTLVLFGFVFYMNSQLEKKLQNRQKFLKQLNEQVSSYETSGDYLGKADLDNLSKAFTDRIFWAKKLVALAERTQSQIAITHFSYKRGVLSLYGITKVERDQKEFDLIDSFIQSLKTNPQISQDFPEIIFVKSNRDREKDTDIIRFQVDCKGADPDAKSAKGSRS
jgi:hypothetical protein